MKAHLAMTALLAVTTAAPACGDLQTRAHFAVDSVSYAPDGTLVVFTNGGIFLYDDPRLETRTGLIHLHGLPAFKEPAQYRYSLSRDGTMVAVSYSPPSSVNTQMALYRVSDGAPSRPFEVGSMPPTGTPNMNGSITLSPQADLVAALPLVGNQVQIHVLDAATSQPLWNGAVDCWGPFWSLDGGTLYAEGYTYVPGVATPSNSYLVYVLNAFDARTGGQKWTLQQGLQIWSRAMMADGTIAGLATEFSSEFPCQTEGCAPYEYFVWSADGTALSQVPAPGIRPEIGADNRTVFTCSTTDNVCAIILGNGSLTNPTRTVRVYRTDGTILVEFPIGLATTALALSPDGQFIAVSDFNANEVVEVYRIADGTLVGSHSFTADLL